MTDRIEQLLSRYMLDPDSMNEQQFQELSEWIKQDQQNARKFIDSMLFRREIHDLLLSSDNSINKILFNSHDVKKSNSDSSMFDMEIMHSLLENEMRAPEVAISYPSTENVAYKEDVSAKNEVNTIKSNKFYRLYSVIVSIAAVLMIVFIIYANVFPPKYKVSVATLVQQLDARWDDNSISPGGDIYTGKLSLEEGFASILMDDGAELVLEAPAALEFRSEREVYLEQGKISASVPPKAIGFSVYAKGVKIVDLGTEFGVSVQNDQLDTYVFDGKVSMATYASDNVDQNTFNDSLLITEGHAWRVDNNREVSKLEYNDLAFVRTGEFEARALSKAGSSYHRWLANSYEIKRDPNLVAYYTFEKPQDDTMHLKNFSMATGSRLNALLGSESSSENNPVWSKGRWANKFSMQFNSDKRQYAVVPGNESFSLRNMSLANLNCPEIQITGPITISAWIGSGSRGTVISNRIPGGHCNYRLIVEKNLIRFFRINISGSISKEVSQTMPDGYGTDWKYITVTHDNKTVRFYYNGELIGSKEYDFTPKRVNSYLLLGADGSDKDGYFFNGKIDELALFDRVLSDKEIQEIYLSGNPGQ